MSTKLEQVRVQMCFFQDVNWSTGSGFWQKANESNIIHLLLQKTKRYKNNNRSYVLKVHYDNVFIVLSRKLLSCFSSQKAVRHSALSILSGCWPNMWTLRLLLRAHFLGQKGHRNLGSVAHSNLRCCVRCPLRW